MSGSLPTSKPMMLPRGSEVSAACAQVAAVSGVSVTRLRSTISLTRSRSTRLRSCARNAGVTANAHPGILLVVFFGIQNEWSAESPPIRSTSGPLPGTCSSESTRSNTGMLRSNRGSAQYSVDSPKYEAGTGVVLAFGPIVSTARPPRRAWPASPCGRRHLRRGELGGMPRTGGHAGGAVAARQRQRDPGHEQGERRDRGREQRQYPPPPRAGTALAKHHASHLGSLPSESICLVALRALSAEHTHALTPAGAPTPGLTPPRGGANTS